MIMLRVRLLLITRLSLRSMVRIVTPVFVAGVQSVLMGTIDMSGLMPPLLSTMRPVCMWTFLCV